MIHPEGTCDYAAVVPDGDQLKGPWRAQAREGSRGRLVGRLPLLTLEDVAPNPGDWFTRVTLTADDRPALVAEMSFLIDRSFARMLRPGDEVFIGRSPCGGVGISVLRKSILIGAAGAVMSVPLGNTVQIDIANDMVAEAEAVFRKYDPECALRELPLMLTVNRERAIRFGPIPTIGDYEVHVVRPYTRGTPGTYAILSLSLKGVCPDVAAASSACLIEKYGLQFHRG